MAVPDASTLKEQEDLAALLSGNTSGVKAVRLFARVDTSRLVVPTTHPRGHLQRRRENLSPSPSPLRGDSQPTILPMASPSLREGAGGLGHYLFLNGNLPKLVTEMSVNVRKCPYLSVAP